MTDYPITSESRSRGYDSPIHGYSVLTVEAIDFMPMMDSWMYRPPYVDDDPIHPDMDEREMPASWYGQDCTKCNVILTDEFGNERYRHASLVRAIRPEMWDKREVTWRTSCMVKHQQGITIRTTGESNQKRQHRSEWDMMWELAGPGPISLEDNLDRLLEECHRLFEPKMQNQI